MERFFVDAEDVDLLLLFDEANAYMSKSLKKHYTTHRY
jgi:hypothetical protein